MVTLTDFDRIFRVNVEASFRLCQAVIPGMRRKGWGRIVSVSSIWGKISRAGRASYSASKFALDGMSAAISAEVAKDGILVNCVAPGFTETELTRSMLTLKNAQPWKLLYRPDDLPSLRKLQLSSHGSRDLRNTYITGQNIAIDGGFTRV